MAVSLVEETNVVTRGEPFQFTVEVETNLVPFTVRVNWADPAVVELGLIEVVVGTGLLIVRVSVALPVPPALVALMLSCMFQRRSRCARDHSWLYSQLNLKAARLRYNSLGYWLR
jgi:hypothetical protein